MTPRGRGPVEVCEIVTLLVVAGLLAWWVLARFGWTP